MKKIQLSDGQPTSLRKTEVNKNVNQLSTELQKLCEASSLSYVEMNKALYLADKELYSNLINRKKD